MLDVPSTLLRCMLVVDAHELMAARIAPRKTPDAFTLAHQIALDAERMLGRVNPEWSYTRLRREHDEAARDQQRGRYSDRVFSAPWEFVAGKLEARLLVSPLEIATEGATQHHCVTSYARDAAAGRYAVVRIDGAERATAGYRLTNDGWRLDQVYAACNGRVSDACRAFAVGLNIPNPTHQREAA